jgi:nitroimidazol reductase NimA-like FMN-containing flavoprotein (pyridoxamine 5'-phosphate oxidase superfamily)
MTLTRDARTGIELIDRDECFRLLAGDCIGRLAVVAGSAPIILPVNYAVDGQSLVFRTAPGTKLDAAGRAPASFEIDSFDRRTHTGWSVVVTGRLEEVTRFDAATLHRIQHLVLEPWAAGPKDHWLRLVAQQATGRRVTGATNLAH